MKTVMDRIEVRKRRVAAHPFYTWLGEARSPLARRFDFAPVLVNFIMAFSDMNKWFMRYAAPASAYERAINRHTHEDERHSRLFIEDWRKLGLDERLGWTAGETLAWYHAAPETEPFRAHGMRIVEMLVGDDDPLIRFALMESIEAWGHVMFAASAAVATRLSGASGVEYRYFGPYHLKRELGHLLGGACLFEGASLDEDRRARALALVDRFFDIADDESDRLLAYARAAVDGEPAAHVSADVVTRAPARRVASHAHDRLVFGPPRIQRVLDERRRTAAEHPLLAWMQAGGDPARKLRQLALFWAPDCLGYRDLNLHALTYAEPRGPEARAINRRVAALGTHHRLFLADWAALDMDRALGFTASDTLEFYCRSRHSEVQRESMAEFLKLAFRHPEPALRHWLLVALEASGEAFFAGTRALATRVERTLGVRLDYLADRHDVAERMAPQADDPEADAVSFRGFPLTSAQEEVAVAMIHTVFDRLDLQLSRSLEQATSERFVGEPAARGWHDRARVAV